MPQNKHSDIFFKSIYRRIAEIRREKGLTQEKLAEIMNVAPREIQRWESTGGMSLQTLKKFSEALECHPSEFFEKPKSIDPESNHSEKRNRYTS